MRKSKFNGQAELTSTSQKVNSIFPLRLVKDIEFASCIIRSKGRHTLAFNTGSVLNHVSIKKV